MTCGPPLIRPDWLWWATLKVLCLFPNSDQANLEGKTHVSCDVRLDLHTRFVHYTQVWELEKGLMQRCKGMANMHISQVLQWVLFQLDVCFSLTLSWHPIQTASRFHRDGKHYDLKSGSGGEKKQHWHWYQRIPSCNMFPTLSIKHRFPWWTTLEGCNRRNIYNYIIIRNIL